MSISKTTRANVQKLVAKIATGNYTPSNLTDTFAFLDAVLSGSIKELRDLKNHPEKSKGKFHRYVKSYILTKAMRNETFSVPVYFTPDRVYPSYFPAAVDAYLDLNDQHLIKKNTGNTPKKIKEALGRIKVKNGAGRYTINRFANPKDVRTFLSIANISHFSPRPYFEPNTLTSDFLNILKRVGISTTAINSKSASMLQERLTLLLLYYATGVSFSFEKDFLSELDLALDMEARLAMGVKSIAQKSHPKIPFELILQLHIKSHELDSNLALRTAKNTFTAKEIFRSGLPANKHASPEFLQEKHLTINTETGGLSTATELRPTLDDNFFLTA